MPHPPLPCRTEATPVPAPTMVVAVMLDSGQPWQGQARVPWQWRVRWLVGRPVLSGAPMAAVCSTIAGVTALRQVVSLSRAAAWRMGPHSQTEAGWHLQILGAGPETARRVYPQHPVRWHRQSWRTLHRAWLRNSRSLRRRERVQDAVTTSQLLPRSGLRARSTGKSSAFAAALRTAYPDWALRRGGAAIRISSRLRVSATWCILHFYTLWNCSAIDCDSSGRSGLRSGEKQFPAFVADWLGTPTSGILFTRHFVPSAGQPDRAPTVQTASPARRCHRV